MLTFSEEALPLMLSYLPERSLNTTGKSGPCGTSLLSETG